MTTTLNPSEKPTPDSQQIATRLLEALTDLSRECKARISKSHTRVMPEADLSGFKLGITWLDQQRQRESMLTLGKAMVREAPNLVGGHSRRAATLDQLKACLTPVLKMLPQVNRSAEHQLEWLFDCLLMDELQCLPEKEVDAILQRRSYRPEHWQHIARYIENSLPRVTRTGLSWEGQQRRRQLLKHLCYAYRKSNWSVRIEPLLKRELPICVCYSELADELIHQGEVTQAQEWLLSGIKKYHGTRPGLVDEWMEKLSTLA